MVLDILAVDNFDFTRKIAKKKIGEKLVKIAKIEFLDKNLTFRIVRLNTLKYMLVLHKMKITDHCWVLPEHRFRHLLGPHRLIRIVVRILALHNQLNSRARSHIFHLSKST